MIPGSINIRKVLVKEGLKLEAENQLLQMQEYIFDMKQSHEEERENIAKSYMLECEKTGELQNKVEHLELEVESLRAQLKRCKEKEDVFIDNMSKYDLEKQSWRIKCKKNQKVVESQQVEIAELKAEIEKLKANQTTSQNTVEIKFSQKLRCKSSSSYKKDSLPSIHGTDSSTKSIESSSSHTISSDSSKSLLKPKLSKKGSLLYPSPPKEPLPTKPVRRRRPSCNRNTQEESKRRKGPSNSKTLAVDGVKKE